MKKLTCLLLLALFLESVKAQVVPPTVAKPELWETSRKLRRTGFFLLGAGAVTALIGFGSEYADALNNLWGGNRREGNGKLIATTGLVMMAGSIPVFIIAGNKKRASLSFNQPSNFFHPLQSGRVYTTSPQMQLTFTQKLF